MKTLLVLNIVVSMFVMWMVIELAKVIASLGDAIVLMSKTVAIACH